MLNIPSPISKPAANLYASSTAPVMYLPGDLAEEGKLSLAHVNEI